MSIIEANLERTGMGKIILDGQNISGISSGITINNNATRGNDVIIRIPSPLINIKVESDRIYFDHDGKRYQLIEVH